MKILIICSKKFYSKIEEVKKNLEKKNIEVFLPNCYDDPTAEQKAWDLGAEEHQKFSLEDVIKDINEKLIRRHPHVFENTSNTIEIGTVLANWEEIKAKEKGKSKRGIIDGIPHSLPSLLRSFKILEKVEKVGFKWETLDQAIAKLKEEEFEFFSAEKSEDKEGELGDVFMAWVGVAHFFRLNPEIALQKTNQRFIERFKYLEKLANSGNFDLKECSSYDLLGLWDKAKKIKK